MPAAKAKAASNRRRSGGARTKTVSGSRRADTLFPVGRLNRYIKQGRYSDRVSASSGAFMAAVLEYITAEILELAGDLTHGAGMKTIKPKHINLGVRSDTELAKLVSHIQISEGGQLSNINENLLPAKKGKAAAAN